MVPSRGEPQAIADLMAGNVDFYFGNTSVLLSQKDHPRSGLLAVGTAQRSAEPRRICRQRPKPLPGFVFASWNGFLVPNGTPDAIVDKLRDAVTDDGQGAGDVRAPHQRLASSRAARPRRSRPCSSDRKNYAEAVKAAGIPAP